MIRSSCGADIAARLLALAICLVALAGIGINLAVRLGDGTSVPAALWRLAGYFTILANVAVALVFAAVAFRGREYAHPRLLAGVTAAIVLVAAVYALLLSGLVELSGTHLLANRLLHRISPLLALAYWLLFARKGLLSWRDPFLWTLFPLLYLAYALVRGTAERRFVYPFIDLAKLGAGGVALNCVLIAAGFLLAGELVVLLDRLLARKLAHQPAYRG